MNIKIRNAGSGDMAGVINLIRELALYEKAPDEVKVTEEILKQDGFGASPLFQILLAVNEFDELLGMAFYYFGYSTWKGKMLYLDDLVVKQEFRCMGIGEMLMKEIIEAAGKGHARQIRWHVLEWNEPAIRFYKKWQAEMDPEWITCKINLTYNR